MFDIRHSVSKRNVRVVAFFRLMALAAVFVALGSAAAQAQFTLTTTAMTPPAVDSGEVATAGINLGGNSSVGVVSLTCAVTTSISTTDLPTCLISPSSATPPATPSLTVTTLGDSPPGQYQVTVTATAASETPQTATLFLNVVQAAQTYTVTVSKTIDPTTVSPGQGATATITVTPLSGYTGNVTLSCLSVTPVVIGAPWCSFASDTTPPQPYVSIVNGAPATATLTISTFGTQQTNAEVIRPKIFQLFWFGVPGLVLIGAGASMRGLRRVLGLFLLLVVVACVILQPACGGSSPQQNNNLGYVTPKNNYTLTLSGVDQDGVSPSNSGALSPLSLSVN